MMRLQVFTLIIMILYTAKIESIPPKRLNKKLKRAMVSILVFSVLGAYKLYLLRDVLNLSVFMGYLFVEVMMILCSAGVYKKKTKAIVLMGACLLISINHDYHINALMISPLGLFAIYLRSILFLDIVWDGILPVVIVMKNRKIYEKEW